MLVLVFTAAVAAATQHYAFDDDKIEADVVAPEGALATSAKRSKRESRLRVRTHFLDEIVRSGD